MKWKKNGNFFHSQRKRKKKKRENFTRIHDIWEYGRHHHLQIKCQMRQGNMKRKERKKFSNLPLKILRLPQSPLSIYTQVVYICIYNSIISGLVSRSVGRYKYYYINAYKWIRNRWKDTERNFGKEKKRRKKKKN